MRLVAQAIGFKHRSEISLLETGRLEWKLRGVIALAGLLGMKPSELMAEWEQS